MTLFDWSVIHVWLKTHLLVVIQTLRINILLEWVRITLPLIKFQMLMLCELVATYSDETQNPSRMVAQNVGLARQRADDHHIKSFHRLRGVDNFHTMWFYWSPTSSQWPSTRPPNKWNLPLYYNLLSILSLTAGQNCTVHLLEPIAPIFPTYPTSHIEPQRNTATHRGIRNPLYYLSYITLHDWEFEEGRERKID